MDDSAAARAKTRFFTLALVRIGLVLLALAGFLLWRSDVFGPPRDTAGRVLIIVSLVALLFVPRALLRHWRRNP
jgi:hypothetical protein